MTSNGEQRYQEREKRVNDAIALKKPDTIPILPLFGFFSGRYAGYTMAEMMYEPEKMWDAEVKCIRDFEPDMVQNPFNLRYIGPLLETLGFTQLKWPGAQLDPNVTFQFVEGEYMKADEYDHFLSDMSDFMLRRYWPRICNGLKGFEKLPPLHNIISYYMGIPTGFGAFSLPEVQEALDTLKKAGEHSAKIGAYSRKFVQALKEEGFPMQAGALSQAPFDTLGDFFRGTRGLMIDMYRKPDLVIKACEKLLPFMVEMAVNAYKVSGNPRVFIPLHKGPEGFMSLDQFKKFYWPTFRELMIALINEGLVPCPFVEGDYTSRLDIIRDVPEGKVCYAFEATDMAKAKKALGGRVCIRGAIPISVLTTGTPEDVRAACKKLIDTAGKDGGFIMDASTTLEDARLENVRAMFQFTREYGIY
jgi:uroporphyrinogen-III decarboxylase